MVQILKERKDQKRPSVMAQIEIVVYANMAIRFTWLMVKTYKFSFIFQLSDVSFIAYNTA